MGQEFKNSDGGLSFQGCQLKTRVKMYKINHAISVLLQTAPPLLHQYLIQFIQSVYLYMAAEFPNGNLETSRLLKGQTMSVE